MRDKFSHTVGEDKGYTLLHDHACVMIHKPTQTVSSSIRQLDGDLGSDIQVVHLGLLTHGTL